MRTFLVTGGAGFIGSHLVESLLERGDRVRVLDNLSTGSLANLAGMLDRIDFIQGSLTDPAAVEQAVQGVDCIFHEAALASVPRSVERPIDTHNACVTGTLSLLDAARRNRVRRLVYAGSSSAYGNLMAATKRETDLPLPISPYAAAKLAGEFYCRAFTATYGFETVCLRYFNVFGPRQDPASPYAAVIPIFISALLAGRRPKIFGDGLQSRDFTYVGNVVDGNLRAADTPEAVGRVFNIANGQSTTLLRLLSTLNAMLGTSIEPIFAAARVGDVRDSMADITEARKYLGYEPRTGFEEGLRRSVAFYR